MTERLDDSDDQPRGFWALVPRRNLAKAVVLLALLAAVVFLQRQSGAIIKIFTDVLSPGSQVTPR